LTDQGKEWETLESLFDHAIKEETKLLVKDRVTDVSPPYSAKRAPTLAAMPAQVHKRQQAPRQQAPNAQGSSESYKPDNFLRWAKYSKWNQKTMDERPSVGCTIS
jgi:hypothetical protein